MTVETNICAKNTGTPEVGHIPTGIEKALDLTGGDSWVVHADNADVLPQLPDECFRLIYIDPPFNSGKVQRREELATVRCDDGDRVGSAAGGTAPWLLALLPTATCSTTTWGTSGHGSSTPAVC